MSANPDVTTAVWGPVSADPDHAGMGTMHPGATHPNPNSTVPSPITGGPVKFDAGRRRNHFHLRCRRCLLHNHRRGSRGRGRDLHGGRWSRGCRSGLRRRECLRDRGWRSQLLDLLAQIGVMRDHGGQHCARQPGVLQSQNVVGGKIVKGLGVFDVGGDNVITHSRLRKLDDFRGAGRKFRLRWSRRRRRGRIGIENTGARENAVGVGRRGSPLVGGRCRRLRSGCRCRRFRCGDWVCLATA